MTTAQTVVGALPSWPVSPLGQRPPTSEKLLEFDDHNTKHKTKRVDCQDLQLPSHHLTSLSLSPDT